MIHLSTLIAETASLYYHMNLETKEKCILSDKGDFNSGASLVIVGSKL